MCGESVGMNRVSDVRVQLNLQINGGRPALIQPLLDLCEVKSRDKNTQAKEEHY